MTDARRACKRRRRITPTRLVRRTGANSGTVAALEVAVTFVWSVMARPVAYALVFLLLAAPAAAQGSLDSLDSSRRRAPAVFTVRDALVLTLFTGASVGLMQADTWIARDLADEDVQSNNTLSSLAKGASLVNEKSLFAAGLLGYATSRLAGSPSGSDIAWHATEAIVISSTLATIVRGALGRTRPFVTLNEDAFDFHPWKGFGAQKYRAFPSIHAAASLSAAAVVAGELAHRAPHTGRFVTPVVYTLAILPGLGRMYRGKHWASDILMGSAFGAIVGRKVVQYHHSRPGNKLDRIFLGAAPFGGDALGLVVSYRF